MVLEVEITSWHNSSLNSWLNRLRDAVTADLVSSRTLTLGGPTVRDHRGSPYFVTSYLVVWALTGLPAYLLWQLVSMPLMESATWALRLGGVTLFFAGAYQLTPLKRACLRHCRSPMSYFMRRGRQLERPRSAIWAGAVHGFSCFGCCIGLMLVLVTAAAMQPLWAAVIAAAVFVERNLRRGETFSILMAAGLTALGGATLIHPALAAALIQGV